MSTQPAVRISRETRGDLHDAYIIRSGRVFYRLNCGTFQTPIPRTPGATNDLAVCVSLNLDLVLDVVRSEGRAQWEPLWKLKEKVKQFRCTADTVRIGN